MPDIDLNKINEMVGQQPASAPSASKPSYAKGKGKTYYKATSLDPKTHPKAHPKSVQITKFTGDLEMESSYPMSFIESNGGGYYDCSCPASKFDCRHKSILKAIDAHQQINGEKFYCFETKTFHDMKDVS